MAELRKIIIDDIEVEVDPAMTLIQAGGEACMKSRGLTPKNAADL